ncbi:hypothetical protein GQ600_967 [Phytophthora cactorum]|nr:hypothetical protein GQ600_967 [Phytophthora cactorum]
MSYGEGGRIRGSRAFQTCQKTGMVLVTWFDGEAIHGIAVRRRHYKVARWLKEYVPYESTEEELDTMVEIAVNDGPWSSQSI